MSAKWFPDLTSDLPVHEAASRVLSSRIETVLHHWPLALTHWQRDAEHVHQLRVGCRRASAALAFFTPACKRKPCQQAQSRLRKLRRAAGLARDLDVFLLSLSELLANPEPTQVVGLHYVLGKVVAERLSAQAELEKASAGRLVLFEAFFAEFTGKLRPRRRARSVNLRTYAESKVHDLLQELNAGLVGPLDDYAQLHEVRILGKKLRYVLEIVAECLEPHYREAIYPAIEELQEILGSANDHHQACNRFQAVLAPLEPGYFRVDPSVAETVRACLAIREAGLASERCRFQAWCTRWADLRKAAEPRKISDR